MTDSRISACYLCIVLALCFVLASCDQLNDGARPDTFSYTIHPNKQLAVDTLELQQGDTTKTILQLSMEPGSSRVFKYNRTTHPPENLMDAGFAESLYFQLPREKEDFNYEDSELIEINTYYTRSCFCRRIGALPVSEGNIKGVKVGGTIWKVEASINTETKHETHKISFDDVFIAQ